MLSIPKRLVALYLLYEIHLNDHVKTTPFFQLIIDLLSGIPIHPAEWKFLAEILRSATKVSSMTPNQYINLGSEEKLEDVDIQPYMKAHAENMPIVPLINCTSIKTVISEEGSLPVDNIVPTLDSDEILLQELPPEIYRPLPTTEESYILKTVFFICIIE